MGDYSRACIKHRSNQYSYFGVHLFMPFLCMAVKWIWPGNKMTLPSLFKVFFRSPFPPLVFLLCRLLTARMHLPYDFVHKFLLRIHFSRVVKACSCKLVSCLYVTPPFPFPDLRLPLNSIPIDRLHAIRLWLPSRGSFLFKSFIDRLNMLT